MGRHKKYPEAENTIAAFYAAVSDSYRNPTSEEVSVDPGQVTALDYENEANRTEKWEKRDEHWAD